MDNKMFELAYIMKYKLFEFIKFGTYIISI